MNSSDRREDLEKQVSDALTEGEMQSQDRDEAVKRKLSSKYEIRVQAELDPIVEETVIYRRMAKEVDDRYERILDRHKPGTDGAESTDKK